MVLISHRHRISCEAHKAYQFSLRNHNCISERIDVHTRSIDTHPSHDLFQILGLKIQAVHGDILNHMFLVCCSRQWSDSPTLGKLKQSLSRRTSVLPGSCNQLRVRQKTWRTRQCPKRPDNVIKGCSHKTTSCSRRTGTGYHYPCSTGTPPCPIGFPRTTYSVRFGLFSLRRALMPPTRIHRTYY